MLIFFPLQQAARLSYAVELRAQASVTVVVPLEILPSLGSTPCPEPDIMFAPRPELGMSDPPRDHEAGLEH